MTLQAIISKSQITPGEYPNIEGKEIVVYDQKGRNITRDFSLYEGYSFTRASEERLRSFCEEYNDVNGMPDIIVQIYDNAIYLFSTIPHRVILILNRAK